MTNDDSYQWKADNSVPFTMMIRVMIRALAFYGGGAATIRYFGNTDRQLMSKISETNPMTVWIGGKMSHTMENVPKFNDVKN